MTILSNTSKTIHWNAQVYVGRGIVGVHAEARAIVIARHLYERGVWNGDGGIVIYDPVDLHRRMNLHGDVPNYGWDFTFGESAPYEVNIITTNGQQSYGGFGSLASARQFASAEQDKADAQGNPWAMNFEVLDTATNEVAYRTIPARQPKTFSTAPPAPTQATWADIVNAARALVWHGGRLDEAALNRFVAEVRGEL